MSDSAEQFKHDAIQIIEASSSSGVLLRLLGALAFSIHCTKFGYLQRELGRSFTDIDFASYGKIRGKIVKLMTSLGYEEDFMVSRLYGSGRIVFHSKTGDRHCDVFLDKLEFSHDLPFEGRLEADFPTIPLAELLLEKMQIVKLNEKDVIDTIMLLREHQIGPGDKETINSDRISTLCAQDWGLWRTVTGNLKLVLELASKYSQLTKDDMSDITSKVGKLLEYIDTSPKTTRWKLRARVGESRKWYREVDELVR
jgi:hypothetical protein